MSDILIIPNRGTSSPPEIQFSGSVNASASIKIQVLPEGQVSFVGKSGSLFSITDSVVGSLMAVSDISGLPILEVFSDDKVVMGKYNRNTLVVTGSSVGVGISNPSQKLEVSGNIKLTSGGTIYGDGVYPSLSLSTQAGSQLVYGSVAFRALAAAAKIVATSEEVSLENNNGSLWLAASGNVGIGKTAPITKLDVNGNSTVTGSLTVTNRVYFVNGGTGGNGTLTVVGDITAYRSSNAGVIYFGSDQVHYLFYDGSDYYMPSGQLYVNGTQVVLNSGSWGISISGNSATATTTDNINGQPFYNRNSSNGLAQDSFTTNGVGYVTGTSLYSQSDGGMYVSAYSTGWVHQIYGDFRTGQIAIRGKDNGSWQSWRAVLDQTNFPNYIGGSSVTYTAVQFFRSNLGGTSGTLTDPPLQAYSTGSNAAFMSFHRAGNYAVNFGLDSDNVLRIGGWSASPNRLQLDMSGNLTVAGTYLSGTTEALRIYQSSGFVSFYNTANSTRTGYIQGNASSDITLAAENNAIIQFYVGGSLRALINTAGQVAIGKSTANAMLDIAGGATVSGSFNVSGSAQINNGVYINPGGENGDSNSVLIGPAYWQSFISASLAPQLCVGNTNGNYGTVAVLHASANDPKLLYCSGVNGQNNTVNYFTTLARRLNGGTYAAAGCGVGHEFQLENSTSGKNLLTDATFRAEIATVGATYNTTKLVFATRNGGASLVDALNVWGGGVAILKSTAPAGALDVNGNIIATGSVYSTSDSYFNGARVGIGPGGYNSNTIVGVEAMTSNTTGTWNTAVGRQAMVNNTVGSYNTAFGAESLRNVSIGGYNSGFGEQSGYDLTSGSYNTFVGYQTGLGITSGSYNTIIGSQLSGLSSTLSNNIIIADGQGNRRINVDSSGNVGIARNDPAYTLDVSGSVRIMTSLGVGTTPSGTTGEIRATNNVTAYYSDERLKTRLGKIDGAIEKVKLLDGFYFEPNQVALDLGYVKKKDVGVSAQQVQAILPEIIAPAPIDETYMTVRYEKLIPLLIEAIKDHKLQIDDLKNKLANK